MMMKLGSGSSVTEIDVELAGAYWPVLAEVARGKDTITYGELVRKAKEAYPDNSVVQNAIPVSTGRRLKVIRKYTEDHGMPDVTSVVKNQTEDECGSAFRDAYDPEEVRSQVYSYDWSGVNTDFDEFIKHTLSGLEPGMKLKNLNGT